MQNTALVYTDGSCHTQKRLGAWVAIVFINGTKTTLSATENDTTHNRMEILAVLKAIEFILATDTNKNIHIVTDSQYVVGLTARHEKLQQANFITKKGNELPNTDLIKKLYHYLQKASIVFDKIKAHQKITNSPEDEAIMYNMEADKLSRKLVRENM